MKPAWELLGGLSQRLRGKLESAVIFAIKVARSPQAHLDHAWAASRAYFFSVIFISLLLSKAFHIYVHLKALTVLSLLAWGPTFFLLDILLILGARSLARSYQWRTTRDAAAVFITLFGLGVSSMISANISFYIHMGSEIHWRISSGFRKEKPTAATVLSALSVAILLETLILVGAFYATPHLSWVTAAFLRVWGEVLSATYRYFRPNKRALPHPDSYEQIGIDDYEVGDDNSDSVSLLDSPQDPPVQKSRALLKPAIVVSCSAILLFLRVVRPHDMAYSFLSASLPLAPFGGIRFGSSQRTVASLPGDYSWLEGKTALDTFPTFDWLPTGDAATAFPDWSPFQISHFNNVAYKDNKYDHYNPMKDPLHIPNLQNDILEPIRDVLHNGDVKIKHIILIKLESNRQDVFPFRSDSYIMEHIRKSWDGKIPDQVMDKLANLTPVAEKFTGFETGFKNKDRPKPYGGLSAKKAYTSGTYTMKSITGTMCGVSPMAVQDNLEYFHDIYQPCLPHIFEALSQQSNITSKTEDWTSWPWHSKWMQSHYGTWDHQQDLTPTMGFKDITTKESINDAGAIYIPEEPADEQKYGHPDHTLKNYMRDAFAEAKKNNTRLFIGHLTHNTHTPWFKPGEYEDFFGNGAGWNDKLNRYLNTVKYQDDWLATILEILAEAGVADETLLVMAGDHFHVPLLFAHPKLPPVEISGAVLSTQILPSILDLLIETSNVNEQSAHILKDLLPLYEGQSLLRPLIPEQDKKQEWHFSTMNPGGTWVSMRAAAKPYRLVVPLIPNAPWRFSNVVTDPLEFAPEEDLDIVTLFDAVQTRHGPEVAKWLSEAAHVSQWWIAENHLRWKYSPNDPRP
ncbi:Alkaline phosphatase-like, alpha/beta/alpha [Penicillium italicum]|uniref:Alkaline phosphatase-like, alpha/beta/alpha n=1 Tax=Penicillium italicum TaxID=40296 RepID=A0A0A2L801_PENIT|nr:Alkaline phosphatase-like, alpha/beta/alpha [Penicillium italicum]